MKYIDLIPLCAEIDTSYQNEYGEVPSTLYNLNVILNKYNIDIDDVSHISKYVFRIGCMCIKLSDYDVELQTCELLRISDATHIVNIIDVCGNVIYKEFCKRPDGYNKTICNAIMRNIAGCGRDFHRNLMCAMYPTLLKCICEYMDILCCNVELLDVTIDNIGVNSHNNIVLFDWVF